MPRAPTKGGRSKSYSQSYIPKKTKQKQSFDTTKITDKWAKQWNAKKRSLAKGWVKYPGEYGPGYAPATDPKFDAGFKREEKKSFGKKGFGEKEPEKEFKKIINRKNWDTSKYRVYKWYGVAKELGPKLIFELSPTSEFSKYYKLRRDSSAEDVKRVLKHTKEAIEKMLAGLLIYADYIINKYVPKDSGDLRKALLKSIKKSKVSNFRTRVVIETKGIEYANPVNNMPEKMIRHDKSGKKGRRGISRKTGKRLHDPKAVFNWWQMIDMQLNTKAKELLKIMIDDIVNAWIYRLPPSGFVHPKVGTEEIMIESAKARHNRLKAYESYHKQSKRGTTREERAKIKAGWYKAITPRHTEIKEIPIGRDDWNITLGQMRERIYKKSLTKTIPIAGTLFGIKKVSVKQDLVVKYNRSLIKGMFKISGLNRR